MEKWMKKKSPAPPPPPPAPPTTNRLPSSPQPSPVKKTKDVDRAAVMADIRRAPRLKNVDRSLIQDRSEAALYFGAQDVPKLPAAPVPRPRSSKASSIASSSSAKRSTQSSVSISSQNDQETRKLAGGANVALDYPTTMKRPPSAPLRIRPPSPSPTLTQADVTRPSRRPSSALATMSRMLSRSQSPSPNYQSVANLFPITGKLYPSNGTDFQRALSPPPRSKSTTAATVSITKTIKRQAPKIPDRSTPSPTLPSYFYNGATPVGGNQTKMKKQSEHPEYHLPEKKDVNLKQVHFASNQYRVPNNSFYPSYEEDFQSARTTVIPYVLSGTGHPRSSSVTRSPVGTRITRTQATFEAKYTFHSMSSLVPPEDFHHLPKTYPSIQYRVFSSERNAPPPKRSLLA